MSSLEDPSGPPFCGEMMEYNKFIKEHIPCHKCKYRLQRVIEGECRFLQSGIDLQGQSQCPVDTMEIVLTCPGLTEHGDNKDGNHELRCRLMLNYKGIKR